MRHGRSTLLGLAEAAPRRDRPWSLRWGASLALLALLAAPGLIIAFRLLPPEGAGWPLYALHDAVFVPFWAFVWVRAGIWSLLWWGPILLLTLAALVEFLGIGQPLRSLQIAGLRGLMRGPAAKAALTAQQMLGWRRNHEGLMVAVLEADLLAEEIRARAALEAGLPETPTRRLGRLGRLTEQLAYLRAGDPVQQLRGAEALAMVDALAGAEATAPLRDRLARIWPEEAAQRISDLGQAGPEALPGLLSDLRQGRLTAPDLALVTLAMARPQALARPDLVRAWFTEWAQLRHQAGPSHADLVQAERVIAFEFWAARAETVLIAAEEDRGPGRNGWLSGLLPSVAPRRPLGERAAIGAAEAGG